MAVNPVTLAETLRPWHGAGITCLLREPAFAECADAVEEAPLHARKEASTQAADGSVHQTGLPFAPDAPGAHSAPSGNESDGTFTSPFPHTAQESGSRPAAGSSRPQIENPAPLTHPTVASSTQQTKDSAAVPAPPAHPSAASPAQKSTGATQHTQTDLPAAWKRILERTPTAPLVWTYAELGADLNSPSPEGGSKERSELLRALISALALPRGSSAFWPVTLEMGNAPGLEHDAPAPDSACFRHGLTRIAPKAVVFFGPQASRISGMGLTLHVPFTQALTQGRLHVLLPDLNELAHNEPLKNRAIAYLRSAFANFPALFIKR